MVCGMTTTERRTRVTPMEVIGALLAGLGALLLLSTVIGSADAGRGDRGIIGAVLLVGGLILNQLAARRQ